MNKQYFDHEKLNVYQKSLDFIRFTELIRKKAKYKINAFDQLDRASTSIALNIAEGNGKYSGRDRCRYFDIARGSAFECSSCLDVLNIKKIIDDGELFRGKELLKDIVSMLVGLIKNNSGRSFEPQENYPSKN